MTWQLDLTEFLGEATLDDPAVAPGGPRRQTQAQRRRPPKKAVATAKSLLVADAVARTNRIGMRGGASQRGVALLWTVTAS